MSNNIININQELEVQEIIKHKVGVVKNVLTAEECKEIIKRGVGVGFTKYDEENRLDQRDKYEWYEDLESELAKKLFESIKPLLKPELRDGRYPVSIRDKMRLYKYSVGEKFVPHVDGGYTFRHGPKTGQTSIYTYVVYLNGPESGLEGGSTEFFDVDGWPEGVPMQVQPEVGKVVVFQQKNMKHEGSEIFKGVKYIIQGMVMYSRPVKTLDNGEVLNLPLPFPNIFEVVSVSSKPSTAKWRATVEETKSLPDHHRYLLMLKAGHPIDLLRGNMKMRGVPENEIEDWISRLLVDFENFSTQPLENNERDDDDDDDSNIVEQEKVAKGYKSSVYYQMLKAGHPPRVIKQRMILLEKLDESAAHLSLSRLCKEFNDEFPDRSVEYCF